MKIAVDVREAVAECPTGKGQWTKGLVNELMTRDVGLVLLTNRPVPTEWQHLNVTQLNPGIRWHVEAAFELQHADEIDYYLSTTSFIVPFLLGQQRSCLPVVHDMIAFQCEPHDRKARFIERATLKRTVETAAHIFCISQSTKADLLQRYKRLNPDDITVIYAGPHEQNPPPNHPDGQTILTPGTLCPRKNQYRLIRAYSQLPEELRQQYKLVLVGGCGWCAKDILSLVEATDGVEWREYVSDEEYEKLLSTCSVLAFPSLYEGFGLQVLDGLQRGIPVLTSNRGSLKEVVGDAALIVEPNLDCNIKDGLEKILTDTALQTELRDKGPKQAQQFSWQRTADAVLGALQHSSWSAD